MQPKDDGANFFAALEFLSKLHFPREKIKRVIGNLLSLYEGQWGLIQENGYQLVVECILEEQIGEAATRDVSKDAKKGKHDACDNKTRVSGLYDASTSRQVSQKGSRAGPAQPENKTKKKMGSTSSSSARRTCEYRHHSSTPKENHLELNVPGSKKARVTTQASNNLDIARASVVKLGKQNDSDNRRSRIYKRFAMLKTSQSKVDFSDAPAHAINAPSSLDFNLRKEAVPAVVSYTEDSSEVSPSLTMFETSLISEGPSAISTSPTTHTTSCSFLYPPSFNFPPPSCAVSSTRRTNEANIHRNDESSSSSLFTYTDNGNWSVNWSLGVQFLLTVDGATNHIVHRCADSDLAIRMCMVEEFNVCPCKNYYIKGKAHDLNVCSN